MAPTEAAAKAREAALQEAVRQVAEAAQQEEVNTESHRQQLQKLKRHAGNSLILAGLMLHNLIFFNCRLLLLIGRMLWQEQGTKGKRKLTAAEDLRHTVSMATRGGVLLLQELWQHAVGDALELGRLGVAASPTVVPQSFEPEVDPDTKEQMPGIEASSIPQRIMGFLCHVIESRLWSQMWHFGSFPSAFAGILHPDAEVQKRSLDMAKELLSVIGELHGLSIALFGLHFFSPQAPTPILYNLASLAQRHRLARFWTCATSVESARWKEVGMYQLRQQLFWMDYPAVQFLFRLLAHHNWEARPEILSLLYNFFHRIGDTKIIEDSNKKARSVEQTGSNRDAKTLTVAHQLRLELLGLVSLTLCA